MKLLTEPVLAIVFLIVGFLMLILGKHEANQYYQSLWANASITTLGFGVALFVVNFYLDRKSRKKALAALFELVGPPLHELTNALVKEAHDRFGEHDFDGLTDAYQNGNWRATALNREQRLALYDLVAQNRNVFLPLLEKLNESLREFCFVVGWSFDPQVLFLAFSCRAAAKKVKSCKFDHTDEDVKALCEGFLDASLHSAKIYELLNPHRGS